MCCKCDALADDATSEYDSDTGWKALMYCVCNVGLISPGFELMAQYYYAELLALVASLLAAL